MAGLILKLRPREELMINGVVLENGDKNARLRVKTEGAHILRLRDAMRPEDATTPIKRAYYVAQLAVAGLLPAQDARDQLANAIAALFTGASRQELESLINDGDFYQVMRRLREAASSRLAG